MARPILVTGAAGFIGFHLALRLLQAGEEVVGVDSLNDYYDPSLKMARLAILERHPGFRFYQRDLANTDATAKMFAEEQPRLVAHLAAQAGVRYSLINPHAYVQSNLVAFVNVLEGCRNHGVRHLVYASSSSVYGKNKRLPFSEQDNVDHPVSLYAATKKSNELLAYTYSHLYSLRTTGLRFFTVYGPWGRPDMAIFLFTRAMLAGTPIKVFNNGNMRRDFTYVDDVVEAVARLLAQSAPTSAGNGQIALIGDDEVPYRLYNIGNHTPVELTYLITILEDALGVKAIKHMLPMQPGDVPATYADVTQLTRDVGFEPSTPIEQGVAKFVAWYREYYRV